MASRKRPRSQISSIDGHGGSSLDFELVRGYAFPSVICEEIYRFAVRVLDTKAELIAAVDEHMEIVSSRKKTFPKGYRPMKDWDVSRITDFSHVFDTVRNRRMKCFNEDISDWNVGNGVNFSFMFYDCKNFNSDVSRWNMSNATRLHDMFEGCTAFESDVSRWDLSNEIFNHMCRNGMWATLPT